MLFSLNLRCKTPFFSDDTYCNWGIRLKNTDKLTKSNFRLEFDPKLGLEQVQSTDGADDAIRILQDRVAPHFDLELVWHVALKEINIINED